MRTRCPSMTAAGIAVARALETARPAGERICEDPLARRFVGPVFRFLCWLTVFSRWADRRGPALYNFLVARTRYIDDCLRCCLAAGVVQVVVLGAGYDSRAYRCEELEEHAVVFEVDHPNTQRRKKALVQRALGRLPGHVNYVSMDFLTDDLEERLTSAGYDPTRPTLVIWEGITEYLNREAIERTLGFVRRCTPPGSMLVFDYTENGILDPAHPASEVDRMRRWQWLLGEVMAYGFDRGSLVEYLGAHGFTDIDDVPADALGARYCTGPNADRQPADGYGIVSARVAGPAV